MSFKKEDPYIPINTPNADLKEMSKRASIWYDKNNKNSFKPYKTPRVPKIIVYLIGLSLSTFLAIYLGREIRNYIIHDITPILDTRNNLIKELIESN